MDIKLAEHTGFCFGVRRAVDTVYEQVNWENYIYLWPDCE